MSLKQLEEAIEKSCGESADFLRFIPICQRREMVKAKQKPSWPQVLGRRIEDIKRSLQQV